jgi:PAS domain S-box-containing protein
MVNQMAEQSPAPARVSAHEQVRQLGQQVNDMIELLRTQQEILRQYGVNLPSASVDALRRARARVEALNTQVIGLQSELHQLRGLAETTALINSSLDTSDVLNQVIDKVVQLTGAERGYVVLRNEDTSELEFRVARGLDQEALSEDEFIISNTIVERVASTGEPVLTHNALSDPRYQGQQSIVGFALRSILAVPLSVSGTVIGVVYCDNRIRAGLFKDHEMKLLNAFANQAAVAIQNARLFTSLRARLAEISDIRTLMDNVFTSIISGIVTLDAEQRITAYNAAAEAITGVPALSALGHPLPDVLPDLSDDFRQALVQARGEPVELDVILEVPRWRYWRVKLNPLLDSTGQSEGVAMVLDDLTADKQGEAQLDAAMRYMPVTIESMRRVDITTLTGQEREISVVCADVRGFSSFSEGVEPEACMQVINQYLSRASDSIELFEGLVDKYMGDAVTGLFNTQLNPQRDHAVRAVRAAVAMAYDVAELHSHMPSEQQLFYGIGVHTGRAVLGSVGSAERREFSALGDAMDLSKLLQENARRGEIMVSQATYEQVRDLFEFEALAPRNPKGRTDFTMMYRLLGMKRRTGETPRVSR